MYSQRKKPDRIHVIQKEGLKITLVFQIMK